jgi:hypothetical protein
MMILEKRNGRSMDARQPTIPETEWPTKMQESTSSSSRMVNKSSAWPCSVEYLWTLKYSGSVVPAPIMSYRITRYSSTRCGNTCFHTDWSVPNPWPNTTISSPVPTTRTLCASRSLGTS